jgi:hypothetical protein
MIYLYRQPKQDESIIIGADPAEGGDNSTFVALSRHYQDVIMVGQSKEESPQLGFTLSRVGKWFYQQTGLYPLIGVERNVGIATIHVLKESNYPEIYRSPANLLEDTASEAYGWSTNMSSRPKMLDDLAMSIRQKEIKIPSKPIVDELFTFIRNAKTGKPEADKQCHDDLIFALAIAWQIYQISPVVNNGWDDLDWQIQSQREMDEIARI